MSNDALLRGTLAWQHGGREFEGYVARPRGTASLPLVLLAPDWAGVHDEIRRIADRVAHRGHVVVVLDVYGAGTHGDPLGDNHALMEPLIGDRAQLRGRLLAGCAAALMRDDVDRTHVSALGFCFGGLCVLDLARAGAPVHTVISVHGVLAPPGLGPQSPIATRVVLLHGWADPIAPPHAVVDIAAELTAAGADWQLVAFGHAMHAFTFAAAAWPERGIAYDASASARAWAVIDDELAGPRPAPAARL